MPNYEYKCVACEHIFELWQEVGASPPPCPECASEVKKVFHPPRVIFKGSGFYVTDLRAEKEGATSTKSATSASAKSTTNAAAPAEKSETSDTTAASEPAAVTPAKSVDSSASTSTKVGSNTNKSS